MYPAQIFPMEKSRTEINLCRLLTKCALRGRDYASNSDWRLEKYIEAADGMLLNLSKSSNKPSSHALNDYTRRIEFLKKLIDSKKLQDNSIDRVVAVQMMPHTVRSSSDILIKEIHQKTASKYINDVRQELFAGEKGTDARQRKNIKSTGEDLDALLQKHQSTQERVSEDMLILTRNLKEQSQIANQIIRKDIDSMGLSTNQMDNNTAKLNAEAEVLSEHLKRAWKCWLWVILVLVLVVFINMVMLMKFMKKRA